MRLTRVFVDAPLTTGLAVDLPEGAARHVARVLRLAAGDALRVFNGRGGEFEATIDSIRRDAVAVRIGAHHPVERESGLDIVLLQGIARGEKMDLILQKATELGARAFVPVMMARSTVRLDERTALTRRQHWQAVVASACEQCGRNAVPAVAAPTPLQHCLRQAQGLRLLLAPGEDSLPLPTLLARAAPAGAPLPAIALLVGPEGGFDAAETASALSAGFLPCRLGPRVLRTETAGLAALAALQTLAGDLR
ncbi:MAG TPA: 16S rRNA (uracil(1498)-N(3))-methyltransferase [Steroidobacteraceae bacterium]|nr:16S rRNA (uracil(1498)-N(3))-methyltransferase [Steroidobacteraceae bacterium]